MAATPSAASSATSSMSPLVECVPNFSEGGDRAKVEAIIRAMRVEHVHLLDWSMDADHNRSVVTIAGAPEAVLEAAVRGAGKAAELIDLTRQSGAHPRIGAVDVIPFVPVTGVSLVQCVMLARQAGLSIWRRYGVPVYFYEAAAARPDRVNLEDVRRGQFEGLLRDAVRDTRRQPDVGGPELHSTAGAIAIGARKFLIAYNIYLTSSAYRAPGAPVRRPAGSAADVGAADLSAAHASAAHVSAAHVSAAHVSAARSIAKEIRASGGGLYGVKAMGVMANGRAQVSMNITDYDRTPMTRVYAAVCEIAARHGAEVAEGELIGLIPEQAYEPNAAWVRQTLQFDPEQRVLERRLRHPLDWP